MSEENLLVRRIKNGTVIDHIEPSRSLRVLNALGIDGGDGKVVTIAMNMPSSKIGKKDILKVEGKFLKPEETNRIALIAPRSTINLIRDYKVVEKRRVELPDLFSGVFKCPNPTCISNSSEPITPVIDVVEKIKPLMRCRYCNRILTEEELG